MTEILIGPDIAVELALLRQEDLSGHPLLCQSGRFWMYVGANDHVHRELTERLGTSEAALSAMKNLRPMFNWLSALSEDSNCGDQTPMTYGLCMAVSRLGESAALVTKDTTLLTHADQAISPAEFLRRNTQGISLGFLDLTAQQNRLRDGIERRMFHVLRSGQYILGKEVAELETQLADYVGVRHCVAVSSGTDSLVIALMALGIGPGDEVITVPYTWISSAEAILLVGAKPVFVDINPDTFNLDASQLEQAVGPDTKAIMPVSLYGQCADMPAINEIAERHQVPVIEDAAQSLGATCNGRPSCGLSTIGSTSFFPTKPLGGYGDGGALFLSDDTLAARIKQIRAHGQLRKHHHPIVGMNGRLDTLQAAVLLAKLDVFESECRQRAVVAERYNRLIRQQVPTARIPFVHPQNTSVYAQYTICLDNRDSVQAELKFRGIPSVAYYIVPLTQQPVMAHLEYRPGDFPVTEFLATQCLSLPMSPWLSVYDQERVVNALADSVSAARGPAAAAA